MYCDTHSTNGRFISEMAQNKFNHPTNNLSISMVCQWKERCQDVPKFDVNNLYVIIPKEANVSDLNIKFDRETETVMVQYFYVTHLVGQLDFVVDGIRTESDSLKDMV